MHGWAMRAMYMLTYWNSYENGHFSYVQSHQRYPQNDILESESNHKCTIKWQKQNSKLFFNTQVNIMNQMSDRKQSFKNTLK